MGSFSVAGLKIRNCSFGASGFVELRRKILLPKVSCDWPLVVEILLLMQHFLKFKVFLKYRV